MRETWIGYQIHIKVAWKSVFWLFVCLFWVLTCLGYFFQVFMFRVFFPSFMQFSQYFVLGKFHSIAVRQNIFRVLFVSPWMSLIHPLVIIECPLGHYLMLVTLLFLKSSIMLLLFVCWLVFFFFFFNTDNMMLWLWYDENYSWKL